MRLWRQKCDKMSIIPLKNNLNWSNRKFNKSQNLYHCIQRKLIEKKKQVSYFSFFDVLRNYPHVSNATQGTKYKRSQAIQWAQIA